MKRMSIACMIFTGLLTLTVLAQKSTAPKSNAAEASLGAAIHQEEVERNFEAAIAGKPIDGGPEYGTGIRAEGLWAPSVHPDGSRIAFFGRQSISSVLKLQNLFPVASAKK